MRRERDIYIPAAVLEKIRLENVLAHVVLKPSASVDQDVCAAGLDVKAVTLSDVDHNYLRLVERCHRADKAYCPRGCYNGCALHDRSILFPFARDKEILRR